MKGNHMKQMKFFGIIAVCVGALSILSAQTKPSNPRVPANNPPRLPGNNPSLPGANPPHVPGNTNPSLPNGNNPSVPGNTNPSLPGSTVVPAITPIIASPIPAASPTPTVSS
jgi:hypothetical protein